MLTSTGTPASLAIIFPAHVLTNAGPSTVFAFVPHLLMLTNASPTTFLAMVLLLSVWAHFSNFALHAGNGHWWWRHFHCFYVQKEKKLSRMNARVNGKQIESKACRSHP